MEVLECVIAIPKARLKLRIRLQLATGRAGWRQPPGFWPAIKHSGDGRDLLGLSVKSNWRRAEKITRKHPGEKRHAILQPPLAMLELSRTLFLSDTDHRGIFLPTAEQHIARTGFGTARAQRPNGSQPPPGTSRPRRTAGVSRLVVRRWKADLKTRHDPP